MTINDIAVVQQSAVFPQGDIRDPIGVWGARLGVTGDGSGGSIEVVIQVPADLKAAYVYTVYSVNLAQLTGSIAVAAIAKCRILTNWPNVDPVPGVQAYASLRMSSMISSANFDPPIRGITGELITPNDRFLLLFDPRPIGIALEIVALGWSLNVDLATYSFEGYGYFWDRSVLNAPGGPRHPGSS